jgi:hypothetical protein
MSKQSEVFLFNVRYSRSFMCFQYFCYPQNFRHNSIPEVFHLAALPRLAARNKAVEATIISLGGFPLSGWSSQTKQEMVGGYMLYDSLIHYSACQTIQLFVLFF